MLFHTWMFPVFFIGVYGVFLLVKGTRFKALWMLLASYVFYGWWNPLYLLLIVYSTLLDYGVGLRLVKARWKKPWVAFSVINNLALLGFFKYGNFGVLNLNADRTDPRRAGVDLQPVALER